MKRRAGRFRQALLLAAAWSMATLATAGSNLDYAAQDRWQPIAGDMQSPIAIDSASVTNGRDGDPDTRLRTHHRISAVKVVDTGHALQVNVPAGNWVMLRGRRFDLQQIHFHAPAEHTINGRQLPLEGHLVYRGANGRLAVLAVQYRQGAANVELARVLEALGRAESAQSTRLDIDGLLPATDDYYHYLGSLTTPPLSQNVEWYVLARPMTVSTQQIAAIERIHSGNNRLPQPLNGRPVLHVTPR